MLRKLERGLVQVYTGDGKGKTTAAMGVALRAAGHGLRIKIIQFLKSGCFTGECMAFKRFKNVEFHQFGPSAAYSAKVRTGQRAPGPEFFKRINKEQARKALELAMKSASSGKYDLVILDEIAVAINFGYSSTKDVLAIINAKHPRTELVLTGRTMPLPLQGKADLVTEMRAVKHPFEKGANARWGIEY